MLLLLRNSILYPTYHGNIMKMQLLILPDSLAEELQKYLHGANLYVLAKTGQRKGWGELSGYELFTRDKSFKNIGLTI